ncbi:unnamed protein product [Eruca vesicaria subsp. sativa]|uniref:Uncharacterized protein n=1 Tax=Eruca vesicaria subsp. sativa TaxID=29727 RepID=A0ABC8JA45_ERUVS|nr:unnamed protein product [Eruca vesicaria subsp. sativa]
MLEDVQKLKNPLFLRIAAAGLRHQLQLQSSISLLDFLMREEAAQRYNEVHENTIKETYKDLYPHLSRIIPKRFVNAWDLKKLHSP